MVPNTLTDHSAASVDPYRGIKQFLTVRAVHGAPRTRMPQTTGVGLLAC